MTIPAVEETDGRRRRGDQSRALVLNRAVEVASVNGLSGLTIGSLADDLGISKGNITVLFGDKERLQLRTLDAAAELLAQNVTEPARKVRSPGRRLQTICETWFDYLEARVLPGGCLVLASMTEYRARPGAVQDRIRHHRNAWLKLLETTVAEGKASGEFRADADPGQVAFEITAFQAGANTASLLGDSQSLSRARKACRDLIARLATEPPRGLTP